MAIVINGSGTVTGLAVGGLPDGTVDADTLASSAVTEAKIASSAVVTAKLNDDAVTNAKIANDAITEHELAGGAVVTAAINDDAVTGSKVAAGAVIQVVTLADTSGVSGTSQITSSGVSITPSSASNKIMLLFNMALETQAGSTDRGMACKLFRDSTEIYSQPYEFYHSSRGSGDQQIGNVTYTILDSPASTSSVTYKFKITPTSGTVRMNYYGDSFLTLMEIAG